MKKVLTVALLAAFCAMTLGAVAVIAADEMKTIDQPKEKFPKAKLDKKTGEKKKPPVTFNHGKHGDKLGCVACHHTQDEAKLKDGSDAAKSCFECHGPEAKDKQLDSYKMIHDKVNGKCIKCHKTPDATAAGAPTKCKDCHKK